MMKQIIKLLALFVLLLLALPATASPNFIPAGAMSSPRQEHTATLLPNGKVLIAAGAINGNFSHIPTADLFNPTNGLWRNTGSLNLSRLRHTATLLPNGKVLIAGGDGGGYPPTPDLSSAEMYDFTTETWTNTGSLNIGRELHTMTLLANGKVLVVGGAGAGVPHSLSSAELYDPTTGTWMPTGSLNAPRYLHTATLLPNGKVLVVGGLNDYFNGPNGQGLPLSSAELYDPITEKWTYTYPMMTNRFGHTATLLPNGKVLVTGGDAGIVSLASSEIYDPTAETWTATGALNNDRQWQTATLLANGKVLVAGGTTRDTNSVTTSLSSAELYNPIYGTWVEVGPMTIARGYGHTGTLLPSGQVLLTGGFDFDSSSTFSSAELYDPNAQGNLPLPPALGISTYSNQQPVVFFPTATGGNYVLQMTTDLASGDWVTVSNGIPISGIIFTNPPANAFFRLH
ncbi:MAG: kelch repeat-containing protein [Verrucomicrobiota bacterium]